ncbi:MAG: guanylate kinase [Acidimicrobiales bacterium]
MAARHRGLLVVVVGPSGVGKGTIVAALMAGDTRLWLSRSWTTRARRPGEVADAYEFVGREHFQQAAAEGRFLEWAEVFGQLYGTPVPDPPPGCDVVLEIDVQGAEQVLSRCPDAVVVLIVPPSRQVQAERLAARGDDPTEIARRIALAGPEESRARTLAHHVVVNDDLSRATAEVAGILQAHRSAASPERDAVSEATPR